MSKSDVGRKKQVVIKPPLENKFEKMFKEIKVEPSKDAGSSFSSTEDSTWIISDNNSTFKSFISNG